MIKSVESPLQNRLRLQVVRSLFDVVNLGSEADSRSPIPAIGRVIESNSFGFAVDSLVLFPSPQGEECTAPVAACLPLESGTDETQALWAGAAAPCLAALRQVDFEIGAHAVILGLDLFGLLLVSVCRLAGAGNISVLDARASRCAIAEKLGAARVASPEEPGWPEALVQGSSRGGTDVVFATVTDAGLVEAILPKCRKEARVLLLAPMATGPINLYQDVHTPGRIILGVEPKAELGTQWTQDALRLLRLSQAGRYHLQDILTLTDPVDYQS